MSSHSLFARLPTSIITYDDHGRLHLYSVDASDLYHDVVSDFATLATEVRSSRPNCDKDCDRIALVIMQIVGTAAEHENWSLMFRRDIAHSKLSPNKECVPLFWVTTEATDCGNQA